MDSQQQHYNVRRVLTLKAPHIDRILAGEKDIEIRGGNTKIRGWIALARSGGKQVRKGWVRSKIEGVVRVVDSKQLPPDEYAALESRHLSGNTNDTYKKPHGWFLADVVRFESPLEFEKRAAGVIWSCLQSETTLAIESILRN